MCIALPYRIVRLLDSGRALAEGPEGVRVVDVSSCKPPEPGTYVLVAYGAAIQTLEPDQAAEILEIWTNLGIAEGS